jgi:hypothetical protein
MKGDMFPRLANSSLGILEEIGNQGGGWGNERVPKSEEEDQITN